MPSTNSINKVKNIMANADTKTKIKPNVSLQEPPLFKIIYINDEHTSQVNRVGDCEG